MAMAEGEVRHRAPFRTGHLRRSITTVIQIRGNVFTATIGTAVRYALFLEQGTGLYGPRNRRIVPLRARALRWPAGGTASMYVGGRRRQGAAGPGFTLAGRQRSGAAGAQASYVFARSVKGIHPLHFFQDGLRVAQGKIKRELALIPQDAAAELRKAA